MPLALQTVNGIHIAALSGPLDNGAADLVTSIKASVEKGASIVLDCTLVSHMDVAGFRHLLALNRWSQAGNGRLVLAGMSPEAWSLIVENHCENTFEARPSVPAALQALGADPSMAAAGDMGASGAAYEAEPEPFGTPPPMESAESYSQSFDFGSAPAADPWAQSQPPPMPASSGSSSSWAAASGGGDDAWAPFQRQMSGPDAGAASSGGGKRTRLPWIIGAAVVGVILLVLGGLWLADYLKEPVIEVSEAEVEVKEGQEIIPLEISVSNGVLDQKSIRLPKGLEVIEQGLNDEGKQLYSIEGSPLPGATDATVELTAARENNPNRRARPVELSIKVREKPLEWRFDPPPLRVGTEIAGGYTTIVTGAQTAAFSQTAEAPPGLLVKQSPNNPQTWLLAGTPANAGTFDVVFAAATKNGTQETKPFRLTIQPPPPPPAPPPNDKVVSGAEGTPEQGAPGQGNPVQGVPEKTVAVSPGELIGNQPGVNSAPPSPPGVDDSMRAFLLERIEKANEHFSEEEKANLRKMVSYLTNARMVVRVTFPTGKTTLLERAKRNIQSALEDPENRKLLDDEDCQILVIGYASPTGPRALNIRLSRGRASAVNAMLRQELGKGADLCGDYGPTDIVSEEVQGNQAVEVFAGKIAIPDWLEATAEKFKDDFNRNHGARGSAE